MAQNGVRHILIAENNDLNKPMGIVTRSDFAAYLRANMDIDDVNAKISESILEESRKD